MLIKNGREEGIAYSLSRWTDVPAAKWPWFRECLRQGELVAFDQRDAMPYRWNLSPGGVHGLVFWTKNPRNLIDDRAALASFPLHVHVTLTGWEEVEKGAPSIKEGCQILREAADTFGPDRVTWRLSPIPVLPYEVLMGRFTQMASAAKEAGLKKVIVAFIQTNDLVHEPRSGEEKLLVLKGFADLASSHDLDIELCNDDVAVLDLWTLDTAGMPHNLRRGVCVPPGGFGPPSPAERCGCALMADPFTINESCVMGCEYCYAADQSLAVRKRNTTKALRVIR